MSLFVKYIKRLGQVLLVIILLYVVGRPLQIWVDGFYSGVRDPYLQMMTTDAVTIRWQSEKPYAGVVRFGESLNKQDKVVTEPGAAEEHEIRLFGLKAGTKYFYSAGDSNSAPYKGKDFWFVTAPAKTQPTRFWVTGDQGYPGKYQAEVRDAAFNWMKANPRKDRTKPLIDLWLTTGDNAYRSGSNKQFQAGFFEPYKHIIRNTPVIPVYGNHDARRWVFFDVFTFPENAEQGGIASGTEKYFSVDYSNIHFVFLDTESSSMEKDSEMLQWLEKVLARSKQLWTLVLFHHPPYTKGSHDSDDSGDSRGRLIEVRENIVPLLEKYGVDLVLSGHSHMYERSDLMACHYGYSESFKPSMIRKSKDGVYQKANGKTNTGTIYTVIGSSSKLDHGPLNHPAMPHAYQQAGSMMFDIDKNILQAFFINREGHVIDQFRIIKNVGNIFKCK